MHAYLRWILFLMFTFHPQRWTEKPVPWANPPSGGESSLFYKMLRTSLMTEGNNIVKDTGNNGNNLTIDKISYNIGI